MNLNTAPSKQAYYAIGFELLLALKEAKKSLLKMPLIESEIGEATDQIHNLIWDYSEGRTSTKFFHDVENISYRFAKLVEALNKTHEAMSEEGRNSVFSGDAIKPLMIIDDPDATDTLEEY
jgi:hypothetical protein